MSKYQYVALFASTIAYISKGVELSQSRLIQRAIRQNTSIRHMASKQGLLRIVSAHIPVGCVSYSIMMESIAKLPEEVAESESESAAMQVSGDEEVSSAAATGTMPMPRPTAMAAKDLLPEVEIYTLTLILTTLLGQEDINLHVVAAYLATHMVHRLQQFNRRSLDALGAKALFYYSLAHEKINKLEQIRSTLMACYQSSCYHRDEMTQIVLLNCLIRNYFEYGLTEQVQILTDKTHSSGTDPSATVSHNQYCRYAYYVGRMHAIQLEYSKAYSLLLMAMRKAPQDYAFGFMKSVTKLMVLVQLLMGGIPERSLFNGGNHVEVRDALKPYLYLTQAVRAGDIQTFNLIAEHPDYKPLFVRDKNYSLIQRLGHNVLKAGLKKISVSYSRINFADIATKLRLPSPTAAEFVCAKAVRDGVIEATIDHSNGWLISEEMVDIYSSEEPQRAFHKRIVFCLELHNDAVKAMRYPPTDDALYKKQLAVEEEEEKKRKGKDDGKGGAGTSGGKRGNDGKSIDEIIKEMEEEDDEGDMDM